MRYIYTHARARAHTHTLPKGTDRDADRRKETEILGTLQKARQQSVFQYLDIPDDVVVANDVLGLTARVGDDGGLRLHPHPHPRPAQEPVVLANARPGLDHCGDTSPSVHRLAVISPSSMAGGPVTRFQPPLSSSPTEKS